MKKHVFRIVIVGITCVLPFLFLTSAVWSQAPGDKAAAEKVEKSDSDSMELEEYKGDSAGVLKKKKLLAKKKKRVGTAVKKDADAPPAVEVKEPVRKEKDGGGKETGDNKYAADGLLEAGEGDYRYSRIPEKKVVLVQEKSPYDMSDQSKEIKKLEDPGQEAQSKKGFLGFSHDQTQNIAKGVLIFIILLIFILYKLRSRSKNSSVLKRFP